MSMDQRMILSSGNPEHGTVTIEGGGGPGRQGRVVRGLSQMSHKT